MNLADTVRALAVRASRGTVLSLTTTTITTTTTTNGLDVLVAPGGANFSAGQRQLLSLARAMLRRPRVLLLDEASSNVDTATDAVVQRSMRAYFGRGCEDPCESIGSDEGHHPRGCTVLAIAHRLETILDSDRILVLDRGRVAEFDSPQNLLRRPSSEGEDQRWAGTTLRAMYDAGVYS